MGSDLQRFVCSYCLHEWLQAPPLPANELTILWVVTVLPTQLSEGRKQLVVILAMHPFWLATALGVVVRSMTLLSANPVHFPSVPSIRHLARLNENV